MKGEFNFKAACITEAGKGIDAGKSQHRNRPLRWDLEGPWTNQINLNFVPRVNFCLFNREVAEARE